MRRVVLAFLLALVAAPAAHAASPLLGIKGDAPRFQGLTNQQSQVQHVIVAWGQGLSFGSKFPDLIKTLGPIPMIGLNTKGPNGKEAITPQQIALGQGDAYLIALNAAVSGFGQKIYIRPFGEMNGHWNAYCAYTATGKLKPGHETAWFKKAFARVYLIVHGGPASAINAKLKALGLPPIAGDLPSNPMPNTRVIWNPQGYGSPDIPGNSAQAYYPGDAYVDVVGNDLYDIKNKAEWPANEALYKAHPGKPYSFPEWGLWGIDDPKFVCTMSEFLQTHLRTEMASYFESAPGSIFDLATKPGSKLAYRNGISPLGLGQKADCKKAAPPPPKPPSCTGVKKKLFDNSNVSGVLDNGTPPSFSTRGKAYCLVQIVTYHWHNGQGATPGTIGLAGPGGAALGPWQSVGSSGQGGAPNVNWTVDVPTTKPTIINGTYTCTDSDPTTWSQNPASGGHGFCIVFVLDAVNAGGGKPAPKPGPKPKPGGGKPGKSGKLAITASPDTGKPPLTVTFTLSSPKVVQWRIDFGDGQSTVKIGQPPASITHTYAREGDYRPRLTVLPLPNSPTANSVSTSVSVHAQQLVSITATPTSGKAPLAVRFALGTSITNAASWAIDFGDGQRTGSAGRPPAGVSHTYAKDGVYRITFSVKVGVYAAYSTFAQVTVGAGAAAVLNMTASPTSGTHPLAVSFSIQTTIPGLVSWVLKFGDGTQQQGSGAPPASVSHTYTKKGAYAAFLVMAQQQQYGGVQYVYPRGGLAIVVG